MATTGDALLQELQGYEAVLAGGQGLNGSTARAVKLWRKADSKGVDLGGLPLLGAELADALEEADCRLAAATLAITWDADEVPDDWGERVEAAATVLHAADLKAGLEPEPPTQTVDVEVVGLEPELAEAGTSDGETSDGDTSDKETWTHTSGPAPDWGELRDGRLAELQVDDLELIGKVEAGEIKSAARVAAINGWKADPAARLAANTRAAEQYATQRVEAWKVVGTWTLSPDHRRMVLKRGFTQKQVRWMFTTGLIRSLTWDQVQRDWLKTFPMAATTRTGGMLLCFDPRNPRTEARTYSLRCDIPPVEKRITGERKAKYLYAAGARDPLSGDVSDDKGNPRNKQQPFIPNGMKGPDGKPLGNAEIATEGLFDALVSTLLLGIPCVGLTAPGHMRGSELPKSVRVYIGDADQWLAPGLLPTVVGQCCSKGLRLARLPLRAGHDYKVKPSDLHPDAKAGMEELTTDLGVKLARDTVLALAQTAGTPGEYLRQEIEELRELGLRWPEHEPAITNLIAAVADAHRSSPVARDALIETLHQSFGVGKRPLASGVKARLERIEEKRKEEKKLARIATRDAALSRGDVPAPEIELDFPSNLELQQFVEFQHTVRFNELTRMVELDGEKIDKPGMAYQRLAQQHGISCHKQQAVDVLEYIALANAYNPVRDYLQGLKADDTLEPVTSNELAHLFGIAPGDDLSMELFWRSLAGTALRGMEPGSKFDQCPILHGDQGLGKSDGLIALVSRDWYDVCGDMKDLCFESWAFLAKLNGCWLLELGEVGRLTRGKHADDLKVFLSTRADRYAEKNEKIATNHPRRAVTWGTTNDSEVLNDPTGTRRYWIIRIVNQVLWHSEIPANRDRIWRTVLLWMDQGMTVWLDRNDEAQAATLRAAAERGEAATFEDPWVGELMEHTSSVVKKFLGTNTTGNPYLAAYQEHSIHYDTVQVQQEDGRIQNGIFLTTRRLLNAVGVGTERQDKKAAIRVGKCMEYATLRERGWSRYRTARHGRGFVWIDPGYQPKAKAKAETTPDSEADAIPMPWADWETTPPS